ncbi:AMP-binding protein [Sulfitobacter albidus]|uniref:3-methylmercaptopropionyl-CoA ligase n=1 Tax=Sulfitobacter albidus TaxID=2829501 RepID=A0A975JF86_9RHOB|nr:AMP-binding protein [Sulfitobacter albidus]QUJ77368.1 AMP-binding protein [Sulfitobacter albidus]
MNIAEWLARRARVSPGSQALFHGRSCVADYAAFDARARGVAAGLRARGIAPGDRVAIFMGNAPDWLIGFYGILYAGAAAVPINAKLHGREADFILYDSGAVLCFVDAVHGDSLRAAGVSCALDAPADIEEDRPETGPVARAGEDLAWLFYTSGTTGRPKGVRITHGMIAAMALSYLADVDRVDGRDATIYAAPMSHGAGLYNFMHVQAGARHVCPPSGGFDPAELLALAEHFGRAHLFAAPTMVRRLTDHAVHHGARGDGLRTVVYAGGPMYTADILAAVDHFGPKFVQIYGQGECPMAITALPRADVADRSHPDWRARLGSVGRAQSLVEVAIDGGDVGEVLVRGAPVMPGYWKNDAATADTLRDGWLRTGDIGRLDATGYLTLLDRSKDVIISGGSNIYPREVEEVLLTHPGVREASVIGRTHPDWGEEVVACVVGDADEAALRAHCATQIARFKIPKAFVFLPELPKNNYGKVLKTALRSANAPPD